MMRCRTFIRALAASVAVLVGAPAIAQTQFDEDVVLRESLAGAFQFVATSGTLRTGTNTGNGGADSCLVNQNGTDTRTLGTVPAGAGVAGAYLYWVGSYDSQGGDQVPPDFSVTFEGQAVTADRQYFAEFLFGGNDLEFFGGVTDVTAIVNARANINGTYSFGGLTVDNGLPHCDLTSTPVAGAPQSVIAGWSLIVIYSDPNEPNRVVNIFDGLQIFRNQALNLTPDNFRTPPNPDGRFGVLTWEGDVENSATIDFAENLQFEGTSLPQATDINAGANPNNNQFNSTLSGPGTPTPTGSTVQSVDFDVYDVTNLLDPAGGETDITTTYSSGGDLVMLSVQIVSIANEPVTDLVLDKDDGGASFTVGSTGTYTIDVTNNGPADVVDTITVTDTLPAGLTFASGTGGSWSCGASGQTVTCTHPPLAAPNAGTAYPTLTLTVNVNNTPGGGVYSNTATVALPANAATFDNNNGNSTDTENTPVFIAGGDQCYLAGDTGDDLTSVNTADADPATNETTIGDFGTTYDDIETIAWDTTNSILYAVDADPGNTADGRLGTVNTSTGAFTPIGVGFGGGHQGSLGALTINDIDGLAWDPTTNTLYGAVRVGNATNWVLVQLDTTTGGIIDNAFGDPDGDGDLDDYVEIQSVGGLPRNDDIAVNPNTGQMYATASATEAGASSLITVNKNTGATTLVGAMGFNQVQGLGFGPSGTLYGSVGADPDGAGAGGGPLTGQVIRISTATGAGSNAIGLDNAGNYEGIDCPNGVAALGADLAITKVVDQAAAARGDNLIYTLTLSNNGPANTNRVEVTDALPAGTTFVDSTPSQGVYDDTAGIWFVGPVANGASATLTIEVTIEDAAISPVTNTATITNSSQADGNAGNNSDDAQTTLPPAADLVIVKTDSQDPATINGSLGYMLDITNNGPDTATNVVVTDTLPASVTFQSASSSQGSCSESGGTVTCNLGNLANGGTAEVNILVTAPGTPGTITNTATVASDADDPNNANNTDSEDTQINSNINQVCYVVADAGGGNGGNDIAMEVDTGTGVATAIGTGTGTNNIEAIAWDSINGILYATNAGQLGTIDINTGVFTAIGTGLNANGDANGVNGNITINDVDGLTFDPNTNTLWGTEREGGDDVLIQIDVVNGVYVAGAFADFGGDAGADDYVVLSGATAGLDDTDDIAFDAVNNIMYAAVNTGNAGAYNDELYTVNTLTGALTLVGPITIQDTEGLGIDAFGQIWGSNGSNDSLYEIDKTNGVGSNQVGITIGGDHESIDCFAVSPSASSDLAVTKIVDEANPSINDTITYTVSVTNNGPSQANAVQIQDILPAGVTYVDDTPSQGTYNDGDGLWYVGTLAASATATLDIVVTVDNDRAGQTITNTASVQSSSNPDPDPANDTASVDIDVAAPALLVVKNSQVFSDPFNGTTNPKRIPGAFIRYTVGITNTGDGATDADTLTVTDPPAGGAGTLLNNSTIFVGDLNGVGSGPVIFVDGQPSGTASGMTYNYDAGDPTNDNLEFSNDNGATWTYQPTPDADGFDAQVTNIRVNPQGALPGAVGGNNPSFQVIFQTRID